MGLNPIADVKRFSFVHIGCSHSWPSIANDVNAKANRLWPEWLTGRELWSSAADPGGWIAWEGLKAYAA